jgi:hypothetical protein
VRQVTKFNEQFKVYALQGKYCAYILLITIPVPETMLILFIYLFSDYLVLVGKHKKTRELWKPKRRADDKTSWLSKKQVSVVC